MFSTKILAFLVATSAVPNYVSGNGAGADTSVVDPEELAEMSMLPPSWGLYEDWDDWESWKPDPFVGQQFPSYTSGHDNDGLVVHIVEFGKDDFRALASMPDEGKKELWKGWEQWTRFMEKDAALNGDQGIAVIIDMDGFTLANYASSEALKFSLQVFSFMGRQKNTVKYGFIINVNYAAETWISIARPFYGSFLDAFEVCGTRSEIWKPKLLRKIPASQVPAKYGGSQDWKCPPTPGNRCPL